jgi:threonine dehydratase
MVRCAHMSDLAVTYDDVRAAHEIVKQSLVRTPTVKSETLSSIAGCEIWLKFEQLQFTSSFKERGVVNRISKLTADERHRGVVAMSAGNHAQGLAYHAVRQGIPTTIVMPINTPNIKVRNTESLGATVVLYGEDFGDATIEARRFADQYGYVWVPPFDDPAIIAGAGTAAIEMLEDAPSIDVMVVPCGGGGLLSGMAVAAKHLKPEIEIIGAETELFASMRAALDGVEPKCGGASIAEGIAVPRAGNFTVPLVRKYVDDVVSVSEGRIEEAMALLIDIEKTVVEGAGATGLAAVLDRPARFADRKVGLILCGGNVDARLLSSVLLRSLVRAGRLIRLHVDITDAPGALARVSGIIGERSGNIIEVSHQRLFSLLGAKNAVLEMAIETRDVIHSETIVEALRVAGFVVQQI